MPLPSDQGATKRRDSVEYIRSPPVLLRRGTKPLTRLARLFCYSTENKFSIRTCRDRRNEAFSKARPALIYCAAPLRRNSHPERTQGNAASKQRPSPGRRRSCRRTRCRGFRLGFGLELRVVARRLMQQLVAALFHAFDHRDDGFVVRHRES